MKQVNQKNVCFVTIGVLKMLDLNLKNMFVCNRCHDSLTMTYSLKNIAILSAKGNTFRCILMCISKNEGLKRLNNSVAYDKGVLQM